MEAKLQAKTKEKLVGELAEMQRRLEEAEEADRQNRQAAASLLESAKLFRTIADNTVDAIICGNKNGNITYWNRAAGKIFGYTSEEITDKPVSLLIPKRFRKAHRDGLKRVVGTGKTGIVGKTVELAGLRQDGTEFPLELSLSMTKTREGPVFTAISRDITERKRAEKETYRTGERLEKIFESVNDAIVVTDLKRIIVDANESVERIFGYTRDELIGNVTEIIYPDRKAFEKAGRAALKEIQDRGFYAGEITLKRKNGITFPVLFSASLLTDTVGKPAGTVVVMHDLTRQKESEEEIRRISRQNERLLNSTGEGIYSVDLKGNTTLINPAAARMLGYEPEEVMGLKAHDVWHHSKPDGSSYPAEACPINATYNDGSPRRIDNEVFWRKDSSSFPVEYNVRAIIENGRQVGTVVSFQDITERRKAEEEMQRLNRALQTLSKANEALIRAEDEKELLDDVCRVVVEVGGYGLTWVGYAEHDAERSVRVAAHAGGDADFIAAFRPSWAEDEQGQNPAGYAIRDGQPKLITHGDISGSPCGWHTAAAACGYEECLALPLVFDTDAAGALCICSTEAGKFTGGEVELLTELADDLAFGIGSLRTRGERERAEKELEQSLERIKKITSGVTQALATAAEMRDPYTAGHQQRVTDLAVAIAREMNLDGDQVEFIRTGGALHDVGKISVPAEILTNPGKLTDLEFEMVREHSKYSYEILKEAEFPWPVADLVAQHHERLDGSGYPKGLKGDEILLEAKILAVADVVEAMSSHRPYRPSLGIDAAIEEIFRNRGVLYDEKVVAACVRLLKEKKFSFESAAGADRGAA